MPSKKALQLIPPARICLVLVVVLLPLLFLPFFLPPTSTSSSSVSTFQGGSLPTHTAQDVERVHTPTTTLSHLGRPDFKNIPHPPTLLASSAGKERSFPPSTLPPESYNSQVFPFSFPPTPARPFCPFQKNLPSDLKRRRRRSRGGDRTWELQLPREREESNSVKMGK